MSDERQQMKDDLREREEELLYTTFQGDIREDVEFLGLTLMDIVWILINTIVIGFLLTYIFPLALWVKGVWISFIFVMNLVGRINKWPYRRKRLFRYLKQKRKGDGESFAEYLGTEADSWMYRNKRNNQVHIVSSLASLPWKSALHIEKKQRIGAFEYFLRNLVLEKFNDATITSEKVPDFRHELWEKKRNQSAPTEGIRELRNARIKLWEDLANSGQAMRSEFTLTLSIDEKDVASMQQEDEEDMSSEERKRNRFISELRQKKNRVFRSLEGTGHRATLLSGFAVPEIISRWLDPHAWEVWKMSKGGWEETDLEPEVAVSQEDKEEKEAAAALRIMQKKFFSKMEQEPAASVAESDKDEKQAEFREDIVHIEPSETSADVVQEALAAIPVSNGTNPENRLKRILGWFSSININLIKKIFTKKSVLPQEQEPEQVEMNEIETPVTEQHPHAEEKTHRLRDAISSWKIQLKKSKEVVSSPMEVLQSDVHHEAKAEIELIIEEENIVNKVYAITSAAPSGKSFLSANISVATSLSGKRTTLIDLSPDRGTLTVLNPKMMTSSDRWETWQSRHAEYLEILVPIVFPAPNEVFELIEQALQVGVVILDIPWNYPGREMISKEYGLIGLLDCDYHHWLQFESVNETWRGELWLNQNDAVMDSYMSQLIKDRYDLEFQVKFPYYKQANKYLFQGRPTALDPELRSTFYFPDLMEVNDRSC